ncbi:MAG TPA: orotate phosphoribosyltransferase [Polyangiaceae bacterium]|jgi:orotate phosphoribosyltransferase
MNNPTRERLVELLTQLSFERRKVTLASGRESDFFIDCKQTILTGEGLAVASVLIYDVLSETFAGCEAVAGVELGGCPLASGVSQVSTLRGYPLCGFYVRKAQKDHGTQKLVEGDKSLKPGMRIVLLEDVITTGGSSLKAVETLRAAGANVVGIIALVDRLEGGADAIKAANLPLIALTTRADFMS